jgi:LCP family protein required for cell wall assembly
MKKKFLLTLIISFLCFTLIFMGLKNNSFIRSIFKTVGTTGENTEDFGDGNMVEQKVKNEILFLLMGVDAKDVKKSKGTRTDTMMLTKVNFDTGEINLLSIPRDTRVLVKGKEDKINHAHSNGGVELTMRTVRDFLNLDIDYYVKVDYEIVKGVVDAIGGVEIDVPRNMKYYDNTKGFPLLDINIKKGLQVLDGKNAHDFLRWRHNNDMTRGYEMGDIGRIETQQYFMKELIKQTLTPKNLFQLPKLIETYFANVETNIPMSVMLKGAGSAKKLDAENMKTATIPGEFEKINKVDYWKYYRVETAKIVEEMFGEYILD